MVRALRSSLGVGTMACVVWGDGIDQSPGGVPLLECV